MCPVLNVRLVSLCSLCALSVLFSPAESQAKTQTLSTHVPPAVALATKTTRLPATNRLNLSIGLPLRNQEALANFLVELYDPASPRFRHYLTTEEFTTQFGPSEEDYQAVVAFART